jgi:hypothetical protein
MATMFSYDPAILAAVQVTPKSIGDVFGIMRTVDTTVGGSDGLKWFNWLYLQVTEAVQARVAGRGFADPAFLAELDVEFARLYFTALKNWLSGQPTAGCWRVLFDRRAETAIARIQFALAGINAHINHDLPAAIVTTCELRGLTPLHGNTQYVDFTALNTTLESLVDEAKKELMVRLLGEPLPPVSRLEDTLAAWSIVAARETAWTNAELLWNLRALPSLLQRFLDGLDGLATVAGKALITPVPLVPVGAL